MIVRIDIEKETVEVSPLIDFTVRILTEAPFGEGSGWAGVSDHGALTGRDLPNQHPIGAITGLQSTLDGKAPAGNYLTTAQHAALDHTGMPGVGSGGVSDHGALTGLADADHPISAVQGLQTALDEKATAVEVDALAARVTAIEQGAVGDVPSEFEFVKQPYVRQKNADGWVVAYELDVVHPMIRHQLSIDNGDWVNQTVTDEGFGAYSITLTGYSPPVFLEVRVRVSSTANLTGTTSEALALSIVDFPEGLYDIFLIIGQSNAQGSAQVGAAVDHVIVPNGQAYEFTSATGGANPSLKPIADPVGNASNGSAWPAFAKQWFDTTGRYAVMVPKAIGGTSVTKWQPNDSSNALTIAEAEVGYAVDFINADAGKQLGRVYSVWWQGEADQASGMTQATYQTNLAAVASHVLANTAVEAFLVIRVHYRVTASMAQNHGIMLAQDALAEAEEKVVIISKETSRSRDNGSLWDASVHLDQKEYNRVGRDAAVKAFRYAATGSKPVIPEIALYAATAPANQGLTTPDDWEVLLDFRTGEWHNQVTPGPVFTSAYFDPYVTSDGRLQVFGGTRLDPDMQLVLKKAQPWTMEVGGNRLENSAFGMIATMFRNALNIFPWLTTNGNFTTRGNNSTQTWAGAGGKDWKNPWEIVVTNDPGTGLLELFVNGVSKGTKASVDDITLDNLFGSYNNTAGLNGSNNFIGYLDYLHFVTRLLDPAEWISNTSLRQSLDIGGYRRMMQAVTIGAALPD